MNTAHLSQPWTRLPGLYRRWELPGLTADLGDDRCRIEPAGRHDCGTDLYAVYVREGWTGVAYKAAEPTIPSNLSCPRCCATAEEFELVHGLGTDKAPAVCMVCNWETEVER